MANLPADLRALTVSRTPTTIGRELRPPRRWITRGLLPAVLLCSFAGLTLWAARDVILPSTPVTVTPVVARQGIVEAGGVELFKAIGWIEPSPVPIEVPALTEGVVKELRVRPGQRVAPNEVIAQLIDDDAKLAREAANLKVLSANKELAEADAQQGVAEVAVKSEDELYQKGVTSKLRLEQAMAQLNVAKARVDLMKARVQEAEVGEREAVLRLERMKVKAPVAGVVMSLNTLQGRMVGGRTLAGGQMESLITLYDPDHLQVRVEVPNDKFQYIRPDQPALVEVDVLPGRRLPGMVLYDTHQTDIQRNTVQVKVGLVRHSTESFAPIYGLPCQTPVQPAIIGAICESLKRLQVPHDKLRPGMIASVRILAPPSESKQVGGEVLRIFVPKKLMLNESGESRIWIVDQQNSQALLKTVVLGSGQQGELVEIKEGLQPSDKLITSGREALKSGERVRITGEE